MTNEISRTGRANAASPVIAGIAIAASVLGACSGRYSSSAAPAAASADSVTPPGSSEWLAMLPDGEAKRPFVPDCPGCHQFDERTARTAGRARTRDEWHSAIGRMLSYAGASTRFPVISAYRDSAATAGWLSAHLPPDRAPVAQRVGRGTAVRFGAVTEFA